MAILTNLLNTTNKLIDSIVQIKDNFDWLAGIIDSNKNIVAKSFKGTDYVGTGYRNTLVDSQGNIIATTAQTLTKTFDGTTGATQGSDVTVAHGLDYTKIVSIEGVVNYGGSGFVSSAHSKNAGYSFDLSYDATTAVLSLSTTNSSLILSKPFKIAITYLVN